MNPIVLTDRQRVLLVSDTRTWINIAASMGRSIIKEPEELIDALRDGGGTLKADPEQVAKILRIAVMNVHMLAVALRQIDRHLQFLESEWSGELEKKAARFRGLFSSSDMKDFRDVLEHSADYVADEGHKPALKLSEQAGYGATVLDGHIRGVHVFGKTYDVSPLIAAALDLMPLLTT